MRLTRIQRLGLEWVFVSGTSVAVLTLVYYITGSEFLSFVLGAMTMSAAASIGYVYNAK